jgi:uncharacterized membrane protein
MKNPVKWWTLQSYHIVTGKVFFLPPTNDVLVRFHAEETSCFFSTFPNISFSLHP